jgi:hypothetical protein
MMTADDIWRIITVAGHDLWEHICSIKHVFFFLIKIVLVALSSLSLSLSFLPTTDKCSIHFLSDCLLHFSLISQFLITSLVFCCLLWRDSLSLADHMQFFLRCKAQKYFFRDIKQN